MIVIDRYGYEVPVEGIFFTPRREGVWVQTTDEVVHPVLFNGAPIDQD